MLLNVVLIAGVAIIGLTQLRSEDTPDGAVATDPTAGAASTLSDPDAEPSQAATSAPATEAPATDTPATEAPATGAPSGEVVEAPRIKPTMRSNFAKGDSWPRRRRLPRDRSAGLAAGGRRPADDPRPGPGAERRELAREVDEDRRRTIGARVLFAPNHSGTAAITAWHTSVLDTSGLQQPRTGMRLTVQPGAWQLRRPRQRRPVDDQLGHLHAGGPLGDLQPGPPREHDLGRPTRPVS